MTQAKAPPSRSKTPSGLKHTNCYICGADDARLAFKKRGRKVVQCRRCGLIYTNPHPVNETLFDEVYDVGEKYRAKTDRVTKPGRLLTYRRLLDELEPLRETNRVLEIGSGFGYFLSEAQARGWQATGVEISPFSTDYAKRTYGVESLTGTLEEHFEALKNSGPFDAVTLWNVFEHLPDPLGSLRQFHELLRPGGVVMIKVPDARALMRPRTPGQRLWHRTYLRKYFPLHAHMHIVHLTPDTFARMAQMTGFAPPVIHDHIPAEERPTRNWRQALRHRMHIALRLPYNFVAIAAKI